MSLTVTWGEKPSILLHDSDKVRKLLEGLLNTWTGLRLPPALEKLDVRCYPEDKLPLGTSYTRFSHPLRGRAQRGLLQGGALTLVSGVKDRPKLADGLVRGVDLVAGR
ncbi:hypothetical protein ZWY2020_039557 [Hordeum vulgare]|nr:hypothetical protein ZWY2020_039557 [Hordeum vulgare]